MKEKVRAVNSVWPTPQARDFKGASGRSIKGQEKDLPMAVKENWATPNTMDCLPPRSEKGVVKQATGARKGRTKPANLREQVDEKTCQIYKEQNWQTPEARNQKGYHVQKDGSRIEKLGTQVGLGKLNPDWVEQLMGLPVGWTQLSGVTDPNENRIDRLRLLGNGVVPQTAEKAFETLLGRIF